jgi:ribonucleoside-triphosphate reductase
MENKKEGICGKETEVYSRIVGYFRPIANWNKGKRQEFIDRKTYDETVAQEITKELATV